MNRTKIICTAGPSVESREKLEALILNGLSVFRINCSHGSYDQYEKALQIIRDLEKKHHKSIAIMIDLQGPKLRIGDLPYPFELNKDELWVLSQKVAANESKKIIPVKIKDFSASVFLGGKIFMDDGLIEVQVVKKITNGVVVKIIQGGKLSSRKGMNIPFYRGKLSAISAKDRNDLKWGLKQGVDIVALSFVRQAKDIHDLRKLIGKKSHENNPLIFAKVEKPEALENLDDIIIASDGILVARGDLGIELQQEKVPVAQKYIIERCRKFKKPNIVATQMLDSMRFNPIPTRAEVSDVANTLFSGADAVLLTGETSSGKYPIEACAAINRIIGEVEGYLSERTFIKKVSDFDLKEGDELFLFHAIQMADQMNIQAIVMLTKQGSLIKIASKFHPKQPIYCLTPSQELARKLSVYWGVNPLHIASRKIEARIAFGQKILTSKKYIKKGDRVMLIYRDQKTDDLNLKIVWS